jgi:L-ascorbate metabolism protein UlaG (beta-lactamase superfamily)
MTTLRFLGVAGYEIEGPDARILIDPFLTGNPLAPCSPEELADPDVILVSHAAYDHLGDAAAVALRTGAPVVCGADVARLMADEGVPQRQIRATVWGVVVEVGGVLVRPVECHHWSMGALRDGTPVTGVPLGFIVETEPGVRIYHYGDTSIFDMRLLGSLYRPTVGLIGCTVAAELVTDDGGAGRVLSGELSPAEAVMVADMLDLRIAIACHYLAPNADVAEFVSLLQGGDNGGGGRVALAPLVGQTVQTDGLSARVDEVVA